jgi:hypothetical protein
MTGNENYKLDEDYPRPGRKVANLLGFAKRDEDGWLWYGRDCKNEKSDKSR